MEFNEMFVSWTRYVILPHFSKQSGRQTLDTHIIPMQITIQLLKLNLVCIFLMKKEVKLVKMAGGTLSLKALYLI